VIINCDIGEGIGNPALSAGKDELIIPFIHAANIACGYHAGDAVIMERTIESCLRNNVAIGAHISYYDRENFGRIEMYLPVHELYELVIQQLLLINDIADSLGARLNHVKPHGALYNMSVKDDLLANVIARAVKDFDSNLVLYGLSGSHSIHEAKRIGLKTASEVFADRTYQEDGSLTPRSQSNSMIDDVKIAVQQVTQMIKEGTVTTLSGKRVPIVAETVCIHGDGEHAVEFAKAIHDTIKK
jgi:5-oxoprolinase (ATP-hydrolysing) subunit A